MNTAYAAMAVEAHDFTEGEGEDEGGAGHTGAERTTRTEDGKGRAGGAEPDEGHDGVSSQTQVVARPQWWEALTKHQMMTKAEVQQLVRDVLIQRPPGPDVTPGYDLEYRQVVYHEVYELLRRIGTLPSDDATTLTAGSVRAAISIVAPELEPDQSYGHEWSFETAIARYAAGDGQYAHCGPTGPYGALAGTG